jgi:acyl dehydratase
MLEVKCAELKDMIGRTLGPSEWVTVTQERIAAYGHSVNDLEWIHMDVKRATAAFGGTIAHGLLTLSLAPPLGQTLIKIVDQGADLNYGFDKVRFLSVVHGGDRVRLWLKILDITPRGEGQLLRMEYSMEIEGKAKPAVVADWLFILFPQADALARQASTTPQGAD